MKRNYRLTISYDGTQYVGWQKQKKTDKTIQGKLEHILTLMCWNEVHKGTFVDDKQTGTDEEVPVESEGKLVQVIGAGRTDAGVHAEKMTASVLLDTEHSEFEIREILNRFLPDDISVDDVKIASERFHARFHAIGKTYRYTCYCGKTKPVFTRKYVTILPSRPDIEAMRQAADRLIGTHDYKAFCGNPQMKKPTVRTVDEIRIEEEGDTIYFFFHGNGFLQNMVRILTGTLLEVGFGRIDVREIGTILESKDRTKAGPTAPAKGLCLVQVDYD